MAGPCNTVEAGLSREPNKADTIQLQLLQVHEITNNLKCTADRLQQIHEKTAQDDNLVLLKHIVWSDWHKKIQDLPLELHQCLTFHEELTVEKA